MKKSLQLINLDNLNSIAGGDEEFKKELIGIFLEQIPTFLKNMSELYIQNNFEKLGREAHTAKSSVLIFGMENTGNLLKDIELSANNKNTSKIAPALNQVEIDLNLAITELENLLKV